MNSERTGKRVSETVNNLVGDKVAHWLRMAYRDSVTKRAAQQFNVSEGTAKRWKRGIAPTSEHLAAMAKAWGWRFVEFVYSPVCTGPDYDSRLTSDLDRLKARIARLEGNHDDRTAAVAESHTDKGREGPGVACRYADAQELARAENRAKLWDALCAESERRQRRAAR